jgi:hypothetical protein
MRALESAGTAAYYSGEIGRPPRSLPSWLSPASWRTIQAADALFNLVFTNPPSAWMTSMTQLDEAEELPIMGDERGQARVLWPPGSAS